jgi:hypothetical protein
MTNETIGVLAAFALVIALASGAKAKWTTNAGKTIPVKKGERWRLTMSLSRPATDEDERQYRELVRALDLGDIEDLGFSDDRRTMAVVLHYHRDVELPPLGETKTLSSPSGDSVSLTLENAEKLS